MQRPIHPDTLTKFVLKITACVTGLVGLCMLAASPGCIERCSGQSPQHDEATSEDYTTMHDYFDRNASKPKYTPKFGLDPVGQAIVRNNESNLNHERRIRLMERQIAQLQRVVFKDPTIQAPSHVRVEPFIGDGVTDELRLEDDSYIHAAD
jgi:hypothetical protein